MPGVRLIVVSARYNPSGARSRAEINANAALVAAAPDLLRACRQALRDIVELTDGTPEYDPSYLRAAIAKAGGHDLPGQ